MILGLTDNEVKTLKKVLDRAWNYPAITFDGVKITVPEKRGITSILRKLNTAINCSKAYPLPEFLRQGNHENTK
jgi:hypothetical protein